MRVHVTLKGALADRLPDGRGEVEVPDGSTVGDLAQRLGLPGRHCVFVVNGQTVKADALLTDGDRLQAFPPMAGGRTPCSTCCPASPSQTSSQMS